MAENTTQKFHAKLIGTDGKEINSCTVKTPKLKLVRKVRSAQRKLDTIIADYTAMNENESYHNKRLADIRSELRKEPENKADLMQQESDLEKMLEVLAEAKDQNDDAVYGQLIAMADLVLNYPNDSEAADAKRTKEDIDWEESDLREIRGAVDFFTEAASSSSNASKS